MGATVVGHLRTCRSDISISPTSRSSPSTAEDLALDEEPVWLSALYALLEERRNRWRSSRDDIDGALAWSDDLRRSIVLFDTVPAVLVRLSGSRKASGRS